MGTNMVADLWWYLHRQRGTGSNYSNNINEIYRTFCPNTAATVCARLSGRSMSNPVGNGWDYLTIRNGPNSNSPEFGGLLSGSTWYGTATSYAACMGAGPGRYIITDQSGCLTFAFASDATNTRAGWVTSTDPCATDRTAPTTAIAVHLLRSVATFRSSDTKRGSRHRLRWRMVVCSRENFSNWYKITGGQFLNPGLRIVLTLQQTTTSRLYQATSCAGLGSPVRCSLYLEYGNTGMDNALNLYYQYRHLWPG